MATLTKTGITTGNTIQAGHVTQSVDAFTGLVAYDITLSGSLVLTGSVRSQNGYTGSLFGTSSWASNAISSSYALSSSYAVNTSSSVVSTRANNLLVANVPVINQNLRLVTVFESGLPTPNNNGYALAAVDSGSDGSGLYYNPSIDTLYAANISGTASYASVANTASYTSNADTSGYSLSVRGIAAPSGSTPGQALLYFIAGATKTDASPVPVALVTLPALAGKILGQNCFVTVGVTGSALNDLVTVTGLTGPNLTFESQNANTNFYYHVIYS